MEVFWTEMNEWYAATCTSSRTEDGAAGGRRVWRVVYDAVGAWAHAARKDLVYYHNMDDETWRFTAARQPPQADGRADDSRAAQVAPRRRTRHSQ